MKHTFTNLLTRLCANTPPCFGKRSSHLFFTLLLMLVMSIGNAWGTDYTEEISAFSAGSGDWAQYTKNEIFVTYNIPTFKSSGIATTAKSTSSTFTISTIRANDYLKKIEFTNNANVSSLTCDPADGEIVYNSTTKIYTFTPATASKTSVSFTLTANSSGAAILKPVATTITTADNVEYISNFGEATAGVIACTSTGSAVNVIIPTSGGVSSNSSSSGILRINWGNNKIFNLEADGKYIKAVRIFYNRTNGATEISSVESKSGGETCGSYDSKTKTWSTTANVSSVSFKNTSGGGTYISGLIVTLEDISSGSGATKYDVNIGAMSNGSITASPTSQEEGENVTLTVSPSAGYELSGDVTVTGDESGDGITATDNGDGTWTFEMPGEEVTVDASFSLIDYTVAKTLTNCAVKEGSTAIPATMNYGEDLSTIIEPTSGYLLPSSITVSGVTSYTWNASTGALTLTDVTGNVSISIVGETPQTGTGATVTYAMVTSGSTAATYSAGSFSNVLSSATPNKNTLTASSTMSGGNGVNVKSGKTTANGTYTAGITSSSSAFNDASTPYVQFSFDVLDGYTFTPTGISVPIQPISNAAYFKILVTDGSSTWTTTSSSCSAGSLTTITTAPTGGSALFGTVNVKVYCYSQSSATGYRFKTPITITGTVAAAAPAPTTYTLTASATVINPMTGGGATGAITATIENSPVSGITSGTTTSTSNNTFTVAKEPSVTVTAPNTINGTAAQCDECTYRFDSWENIPASVTADVSNIHAKYNTTYGISYTLGDGADWADAYTAPTYYMYGTGVTLPVAANVEKDGYTFDGWTLDGPGTSISSIANDAWGNITVTAHWSVTSTKRVYMKCGSTWCDDVDEQAPKFFTHSWNGSTTANSTVMQHPSACETDVYYADIPASHTYIIFTRQKAGSTELVWSGDNFVQQSEDITIGENNLFTCTSTSSTKSTFSGSTYAAPAYTISFNNGGGTGSMSSISSLACGANQALTANAFTKAGYSFANWTANVAVTVNDATVSIGSAIANEATIQNISSDITLTAQWTQEVPTSVSIGGTWRYFPGQTISLTAGTEGGTSGFAYQWQKYVTSEWQDIEGANEATYSKANCTVSDCGSYRCVVSKLGASVESNGYDVHIYTLNGNYNGSDWVSNDLEVVSGTVGQVELTLEAGRLYTFKVKDNFANYWFGNAGYMLKSETGWTCPNNESGDIRVFTGAAGTYTFTVDIANVNYGTPQVEVDVTYPSVTHPAAGYVYYDKGANEWENVAAHWWKNEGTIDFVAWNNDPWLTQSVEICGKTYYYMPKLEGYDRVIFHKPSASGDGNQTPDITVDASSSGKYISGNSTEWTAFAKYTISFEGNGNTSGEMSAIANICPTSDQALTANAFVKSGYNFTGWVADVDVMVSGATVTAGNMIADEATIEAIASNITLTAQWESNCPTSGEVFSMALKSGASTRSLNSGASYDLTSSDVTIDGGYASIKNIDPSNNGKMQISSGPKFYFNGNKAYVKINLDCPLQAGDKIEIAGGSGKQIAITPTEGVPVDASVKVTTSSYTYTVTAADVTAGFAGPSVLTYYLGRAESSGTYMTGITITRPYTISFASAKGTAPSATTGFEVELEQITGVDGWIHTGWTADQAVKVGGDSKTAGTALDVDATAVLSANTTFTAVWEQVYSVTYKANNGTEEEDVVHATESTFAANMFTIPDGKMFNGWNTTAEGDGIPYAAGAAVPSNLTLYAQWVVDPVIRLIKTNGTLNTTDFITGGTLQNDGYTVEGVEYAKHVQLGGSCSAVGNIDNYNKAVIYHTTTNATQIKVALYDPYGSSTTHHAYVVIRQEGNSTPLVNEDISIATGTKRDVEKTYNVTGRATLYVMANNNVRICQVAVTESGTANVVAPAVGYTVNLNAGRMVITETGTDVVREGLTYNLTEKYQPARTYARISTLNTNHISFTIPEGQTRQLQLTTSNNAKYTVSKILGDDEHQFEPTADETKNWNLTEGTWYINPQGSNVQITNIAFAAAPDALTVTYKDGEDTYTTQNVWSGEKTTAPADPTKSGYRFIEWREEGESTAFDFANTTIDADLTLNAVWQKTWTVTFNSDGGSDVDAAVVDDGSAVAAPADPEKAGNEFAGWYYGDPAAVYSFATLVTADLTLTAHWTPLDDDASISALSYDGNAIDLAEGEEIAGVMTFNVLLPWGETPDKDLISVTKSAESATVGTISYESESKTASFTVTAGDHTTTADYAIVFANDVKKGASIVKATTGNVVTGLIGGSIDQSYSGTAAQRKLDRNTYFGIQLAEGNFQEGDVLIINITTPADLGNFIVYADAARTELLADQGVTYTKPDAASPVVCPTGEMRLVLPAAVDGHNALYLSREDGNTQWNVTFSSLEVTREINPIIKSFKFGDDAATIDEEHKTISIDVPYGTDVTALTPTIEAYGNNGFSYTPEGAQDFSSPVNYTVTDGYSEFNTTYAVTVNVADPSENAYLASLSVAGYALDFNKETTTYNVVLNYGTTVLPAISYEVEDTGLAEAEKVEGGVNGATTITVTPQAGAGHEKVYTINFSVSLNPVFVIYDGSTMTNIASRTGSDVETGFSYSMASNVAISGESVASSWNGKNYSKVIKGFKPNDNAENIVSFVIPENYLAKVCLVGTSNSDGTERKMFIANAASRNASDAISDYIITSSTYDAQGFITDFLPAGTYYLGSTDSYRLYEFSVTLYHIDHSRDVTQGRYGTICLPNGGIMVGATIFEVAYMTYENAQPYKVFFDEVIDGVMEPGMPYIFLPNEDVSSIAVTYTDNANASAGNYNGLYGTLEYMDGEALYGKYIFSNNSIFMSEYSGNWLNANRAYIVLSQVPDYVTPIAPNRRRVSMGVNGTNSATGMDEIEASETPMKVMIEGQIYIIRGEKMYDVTGKLVK